MSRNNLLKTVRDKVRHNPMTSALVGGIVGGVVAGVVTKTDKPLENNQGNSIEQTITDNAQKDLDRAFWELASQGGLLGEERKSQLDSLQTKGANVNATDENGNTALHILAQHIFSLDELDASAIRIIRGNKYNLEDINYLTDLQNIDLTIKNHDGESVDDILRERVKTISSCDNPNPDDTLNAETVKEGYKLFKLKLDAQLNKQTQAKKDLSWTQALLLSSNKNKTLP